MEIYTDSYLVAFRLLSPVTVGLSTSTVYYLIGSSLKCTRILTHLETGLTHEEKERFRAKCKKLTTMANS